MPKYKAIGYKRTLPNSLDGDGNYIVNFEADSIEEIKEPIKETRYKLILYYEFDNLFFNDIENREFIEYNTMRKFLFSYINKIIPTSIDGQVLKSFRIMVNKLIYINNVIISEELIFSFYKNMENQCQSSQK